MPVTSVTTDTDTLSITIVADFAASRQRLWDAYTDARQIELFWGPPGWPARFHRHDVEVGGTSHYTMTGPDGTKSSGYFEFTKIQPGHRFELLDGFALDDGTPNTEMPTMRIVFDFEDTPSGSRLTTVTHFNTIEELEQLVAMGVEEGTRMAMSQIDAVLMGLRAYAEGRGVITELHGDVHAKFTRFIAGSRQAVWDAYTNPDLVRRWMLGPDGWAMTTCEIDLTVGAHNRFAWEPVDGHDGTAFGFEGETMLVDMGRRWVTTERMTDTDHPETTNDLLIVDAEGGTLVTTIVAYASAEVRDAVIETGMVAGLEASYARMEQELFATTG